MLKHYQALFDVAASDPQGGSYYLDRASAYLQEMTELDGAVGNHYGLGRTRLLTLLLHAARDTVEPAAWTALADEIGGDGYHFEERLARRLATKPMLAHTELREIFRFYPFVQQ